MPTLRNTPIPAKRWTLVDEDRFYEIEWADGETLLALSTEVRAGTRKPCTFSFLPRGAGDSDSGDSVTIAVSPDRPLELITPTVHTAAGPATSQGVSHWFG